MSKKKMKLENIFGIFFLKFRRVALFRAKYQPIFQFKVDTACKLWYCIENMYKIHLL